MSHYQRSQNPSTHLEPPLRHTVNSLKGGWMSDGDEVSGTLSGSLPLVAHTYPQKPPSSIYHTSAADLVKSEPSRH